LIGVRQVRRRARCACCGLLLLLLLSEPRAVQAQELIGHPGVGVASVTTNEAQLYLTQRLKTWPNGVPVKVFVLPDDHVLHRRFANAVLGLYPYQLRRVWDRQLFSGTGQAPTTVASEEEMIRRVAATPGAVGYAQSVPDDGRVIHLEVR
jgi:hypothetical protein